MVGTGAGLIAAQLVNGSQAALLDPLAQQELAFVEALVEDVLQHPSEAACHDALKQLEAEGVTVGEQIAYSAATSLVTR